jgi:hypothetical protein
MISKLAMRVVPAVATIVFATFAARAGENAMAADGRWENWVRLGLF